MSRQLSLFVSSMMLAVGLTGSVLAQTLSCGPSLGYDAASGDHVTFIGATCLRSMTLGPLSAGGHLAYGFGNYDAGDFSELIDGSYSAIRANIIATYPIAVSDSNPMQVYPLATLGILRWWEDCDFSDCSDTEFIVDLGGGVTYNMFGAEVYAIVGGSLDFGARIRALFDLNN